MIHVLLTFLARRQQLKMRLYKPVPSNASRGKSAFDFQLMRLHWGYLHAIAGQTFGPCATPILLVSSFVPPNLTHI
jgi:hypothetical protein